ncbi:MAG: phage tail protein [Spirochaetota bacterium]
MSNITLREYKGSPLTHEELDANFNIACPVGDIHSFAMPDPPDGWLVCDGSELSRELYSNLFSKIGEIYGAGDGVSTFNIPDLRGEFIRGFDGGRGVDIDRVMGSYQLDQMQRLTGRLSSRNNVLSVQGVYTVSSRSDYQESVSTGRNGSNVYFDSSNSPNARVSETTDGETRPRNISLLYCIKY